MPGPVYMRIDLARFRNHRCRHLCLQGGWEVCLCRKMYLRIFGDGVGLGLGDKGRVPMPERCGLCLRIGLYLWKVWVSSDEGLVGHVADDQLRRWLLLSIWSLCLLQLPQDRPQQDLRLPWRNLYLPPWRLCARQVSLLDLPQARRRPRCRWPRLQVRT